MNNQNDLFSLLNEFKWFYGHCSYPYNRLNWITSLNSVTNYCIPIPPPFPRFSCVLLSPCLPSCLPRCVIAIALNQNLFDRLTRCITVHLVSCTKRTFLWRVI
jgi:hypothetical protein